MKQLLLLISLLTSSVFVFAQSDSIKGNQRAFYECSEPINIDSLKIEIKSGKLYFQFNIVDTPEIADSMGFVWLEDRFERFFTGYLVNTTDSTFEARRQDGSLIMIQEAQNRWGKWKPIEYWVYSGCGNSYFGPLSLDSGKCVMIPIRKYSGTYKTKIRLKFKYQYGKKVIYSEPFEGSIDKAQFRKMTKKVHGILYHGPANYLDN